MEKVIINLIILLLWINIVSGQILTLSPSHNSLPQALYGSFMTINSQNEVIIIGGCNDWYRYTSHGCKSDYYSSKIYVWDTSSSATFQEITNLGVSGWWNPSKGYPFPIYQDIMFIPWNDTMHKFDTIKRNWVEHTASKMPIPLYHPCTVYDKQQQKIYLFGGENVVNNQYIVYASAQIYDIESDEWQFQSNINPMPFATYGGSCVLKDRTIYHFGGFELISNSNDDYSARNTIIKYDIDEDEWTTLSTTVGDYIFGSNALLVNDSNIFIFGGARFAGGAVLRHATSNVYLFSTMDESIKLVTTMSNDRYSPLLAFINGRIYIGGGCSANNGIDDVLPDLERSDEIWQTHDKWISSTSTTMQTDISQQTKATIPSNYYEKQNGEVVNNNLVIAVVILSVIVAVMIVVFVLLCKYFKCIRKHRIGDIDDAKHAKQIKQYHQVNKFSVDMDREGNRIFNDIDNQLVSEINSFQQQS